jgi:hypothetical protein
MIGPSDFTQNSSSFLQGKDIKFSAPILKDSSAQVQGEGWKQIQTQPSDVIDINGNGKADFNTQTVHQVQNQKSGWKDTGSSTKVQLTEPALYFPTMKHIEQVAAEHGNAEIVTQEMLPEVYVAFPNATGGSLGADTVCSETNVQPLRTFLGHHLDNASPTLRYAFDVKNHTIVAYEERVFDGGACGVGGLS